ncbi:hypothetical protein KW797_02105 [Candidatus Parcubacteria bacterium]|nr:hypothetical protein [Candidatus Parcubacteria bacterium]
MELSDIHLSILAVTALAIVYADHLGWQYFRGRKPLLDARTMRRVHFIVIAGLIGMITTGFIMFWPDRAAYLSYWPFLIKMGFVLILVVNALFIHRLMGVASERPYASLTKGERRKLLVSGALSSIGWIGAAVIGLFYLG